MGGRVDTVGDYLVDGGTALRSLLDAIVLLNALGSGVSALLVTRPSPLLLLTLRINALALALALVTLGM